METQISKDIELTMYKASYDESCKILLANKKILGHILKECVEEFKDYDAKYITENCIEGTPEISKVGVHRNSPEKIIGMNTEDKTLDEGAVYYDIKFVAVLPRTRENIRLIINIEAQRNYYPNYSLVRRGLYYCCRLISAQYQTEFSGDNYDDIKKVYSVWVCTDTPKRVQNTITRYKIAEENVIGSVKEKVKNYDIMNVIMVCLDKDSKEARKNYGGILKLLRVLLSDRVGCDDKKSVMDLDFGIEMDVEMEKELRGMCNLSDGVWERGLNEGREKGRIEEREISTIEHLKKIMANLQLSFEQAAAALGLSEEDMKKYAAKV